MASIENHKFRYLRARNFLCFGDESVEFKLEEYGPVVFIKGVNKDTSTPGCVASNGAGKSSVQDIVSYCLFGKTVKKPKQMSHDHTINEKTGKNLEVEIQFGDYRVVRKRKPNKLQIWRSKDQIWDADTEITRGTMKDTQETIEGIIGMNHQAFCNVVVFDDSNTYSFLEADTPSKRNIVENLLGLDQYREYSDIAKELLKDIKLDIKTLTADYERCQIELNQCEQRIDKVQSQEETWKKSKQVEAASLMKNIESKQKQLQELDSSGETEKYLKAQDRISELEEINKDLSDKQQETSSALEDAKQKIEEYKSRKDQINERIQTQNIAIKQAESDSSSSQALVNNLNKLTPGTKCSVCHGEISESNYESVLLHENSIIQSNQDKIAEANKKIEQELTQFKEMQSNIVTLQNLIKQAETKIANNIKEVSANMTEIKQLSNISKPDMDAVQQVLESEITAFKKQLKAKMTELEGESPYKEIYDAAVLEKTEKLKENEEKINKLKDVEAELPYYEFWNKAFGDKGIRKFVVDGIIPALNSRIAYWLQHLYEGQIDLSFDNELVETITRNGRKAYYPALSNGEKQRVNLAVSQSFAYVMMLNSGSCPSLVFLDEITGGGIDKSGVSGVFNMICELSKERQVFITTHNEYLLSMLDGYEEIVLEKEDDVTKLAG